MTTRLMITTPATARGTRVTRNREYAALGTRNREYAALGTRVTRGTRVTAVLDIAVGHSA